MGREGGKFEKIREKKLRPFSFEFYGMLRIGVKAIHLVRNEWDGMVHGRFFAFNGDWGSLKGVFLLFRFFFFFWERIIYFFDIQQHARVRACVRVVEKGSWEWWLPLPLVIYLGDPRLTTYLTLLYISNSIQPSPRTINQELQSWYFKYRYGRSISTLAGLIQWWSKWVFGVSCSRTTPNQEPTKPTNYISHHEPRYTHTQ